MSRVLIACEFSGIVRDAFIAAGHDAVSCDLLPSERPGPHIQGDVLAFLDATEPYGGGPTTNAETFDLLIAHPPCTYLANSGVRWLYGGKRTVPDDGVAGIPAGVDLSRWVDMELGADFFAALLTANVPRVAVENPVMHGYGRGRIEDAARRRGVRFERHTVQPWQYGHPETKATQLWTRNLPPLTPTNIVPGREPRVHHASPGPDRWKERSRTLPGIAAAMAEQWGAAIAVDLAA